MKDTPVTFAAKMLLQWTERLREASIPPRTPGSDARITECKEKILHYSSVIDLEMRTLGHLHTWEEIGEDTGGYCDWCKKCGAIRDSGGGIRYPVNRNTRSALERRVKELLEGADTYTRGVK